MIADPEKNGKEQLQEKLVVQLLALASPFDVNDSFKPSYSILDKPEWFRGH
ncbi:MAG: hypothetical protein IPO23_13275 [Flavobacterium sp.]|nr:hypothetical protein [Flavobacterium sp.]